MGQKWIKENLKMESRRAIGLNFAINNDYALVTGLGVGASVHTINLEEMIVLGAREFFLVGIAGALDPELHPGDVVVLDKAYRDEGASRHYLAESEIVKANGEMVEEVSTRLQAEGLLKKVGATWTVDCPYRETRAEVLHFRSRGVLAVEMEASALYAVTESKKLRAVATVVISDVLDPNNWQPHFYHKDLAKTYHSVLTALTR